MDVRQIAMLAAIEFKGVHASESAGKWLTYLNPENNRVDWGGYDNTSKIIFSNLSRRNRCV